MKKILLTILLLPFLSNCTQYSAIVGPTLTLAETGSLIQATTSLSTSLGVKNVRQSLTDEIRGENICPTFHSSELSQIFFETLDQMDCEYDPMSIYR
tara:strand:- start:147 stop:437 length:291 start_codon:yes stop_codon:yes gene_type:complete